MLDGGGLEAADRLIAIVGTGGNPAVIPLHKSWANNLNSLELVDSPETATLNRAKEPLMISRAVGSLIPAASNCATMAAAETFVPLATEHTTGVATRRKGIASG